MKIDGKHLADTILTLLTKDVSDLHNKNIHPTLVVILVGDDTASLSYIKQKQKAALTIGAELRLLHLPRDTSVETLSQNIRQCNDDQTIHGLIVQRPLPSHLRSQSATLDTVLATKDVDGFVPNSPFTVPVASAVFTILNTIFHNIYPQERAGESDLNNFKFQISNFKLNEKLLGWLQAKKICIIGQGSTAGKPITDVFHHMNCATSIIHSTTLDKDTIINHSDIVISCVGKPHIVNATNAKKDSIHISVGIHKTPEGKLQGDYDDEEIASIVSWYTPTPGGVGPVNVACLMQNLVHAAQETRG